MREIVLVEPLSSVADTGVVESVLRSPHCVHVKENFDVVLFSRVEEPLDLVLGTLSAADVRTVRLEGPVTNRDSDDLNVSRDHLDEGVLGDPEIPVFTQHLVSLLGSKRVTEGVLVHANSFGLSLAKESVEERRSDPWLKHLPATDVGADHGSLVSGLLCRSGSSKDCKSERFHACFFVKQKLIILNRRASSHLQF